MLNKLLRWARALKAELIVLWFCRSHPDTPLAAKLLAVLVVAYAFSPIDLIPDFIPILGQLDDVILMPLGVWLVLKLIPDHVITDSRMKAAVWAAARKRQAVSYLIAALIVLTWIALAWWASRWVSPVL